MKKVNKEERKQKDMSFVYIYMNCSYLKVHILILEQGRQTGRGINFWNKEATFFFFFFCLFAFSRAPPAAYGGFQARGWIGNVATSLRQNHRNQE